MNRITNDIKKELRRIAGQLPTDSYTVIEKTKMTGAELKLSAYDEDEKYKGEFEDEGEYMVPVPAMYEKNHYRRLRRAFQKGSIPGVQDYVFPYFVKRQRELNAAAKKN